jgi:hypothetical protein
MDKQIGKDKSVICGDRKRNCDCRNGNYKASLACEKSKKSHLDKNKKIHSTTEAQSCLNL